MSKSGAEVMNEKYKNLYLMVRTLYIGSSLILAGVAFVALVGLFTDFSHAMNACVAPNNISEELTEMFMMLLVCVFFSSSAFMGVLIKTEQI